jgi:Calcium-dependent channel, 7TM region, putative phosphate
MKNTLSNVSYGSVRLWAPWCIMILVTAWCLWCLWAHCRSYAALQAIHTHAAVLIRELDSTSDSAAAAAVKKKLIYKSGKGSDDGGTITALEDEGVEKSDLVVVAGLMRMVGTRVARERKYGPGALGWWKAAGMLFWQSINPIAMLKADIEFVENCVEKMNERLYHLAKMEKMQQRQQKKKKKNKNNLKTDDVGGIGGEVTDGEVVTNSIDKEKVINQIRPNLDSINELQHQDWGPAVRAEVPEIVCPWWLNIEDTPAAVNPVLSGGGVLLGKTSPHLRSRIPGNRGSTHTWVPASSFVVLYRAGGPTPTDHWGKYLTLNDRLREAEVNLENDNEEIEDIVRREEDSVERNSGNLDGGGSSEVLGGGGSSEVLGGRPTTTGEHKGKRLSKGIEVMKTKLLHTSAEKRAAAGQSLEKALRKLYPSTFQDLVPVYNHIPADKAMDAWDHTAAALARVERQIEDLKKNNEEEGGRFTLSGGGGAGDVELGTISGNNIAITINSSTPLPTSTPPTKRAAKKAKKAAEKLANLLTLQKQLTSELAVKETDLATARAACLAAPLGTAYFALFTSQRDARAAAAGHIGSTPEMNMTSEMAPGPDDVNWQGLWAGWRERAFRTVFYCTIPMVIIILFPIGALTGALTNLDVAVCGSSTSAKTKSEWAWLCEGPEILSFLITVILPITISTFWDTWVMPMVLFIVCQAQRSHSSFSNLDQAVVSGFYAFSFLNTFLGAVLGGSFLQQLGAAIADGDIFTLVGTALPSASNFFLNYIGVHALFTNFFRFIWPHDGTVLFVFFRYFGLCRPKCERDEWVIRSTPSYRAGRHYGAFMATYIMALCYSAVAPLILPITALYFFTAFITWRYSAIHFYDPCYDGGGRVFELSYTLTLITLIIANIFAAAVIMTKGLFWIGGSLIAVSCAMIIVFWRYCNAHVMQYTSVMPMQAAENSPSAVVPRECYLPPVLRRGAVGWFPEGGKIWEKYGLPKFVF